MRRHIPFFIVCCLAILIVAAFIHPGPGLLGPGFLGIHMPRHTLSFIFFAALLIAAAVIFDKGFKWPVKHRQYDYGFTGPQVSMSQSGYGFSGPGGHHVPGPHGSDGAVPPPAYSQFGFTGPSQIVPVAQAQTYTHRSPVIITGNLVLAIGHDLYTFRDSSGEITVRIGPREWEILGSNISPSDTVEISGEVHRDQIDGQRTPEIHARFIRKV